MVGEDSNILRWVIVSGRGSDGRMKPFGVWVTNEDDDIFGDLDEGDTGLFEV
jgi:hypothetical protein